MRNLRRLRDESGMALALAIMMILVLSASVTTAIYVTTSSSSSSHRSKATQVAYAIAESGISNAMAVLRVPTNNALDKRVLCSSPTEALPCKHAIAKCVSGSTGVCAEGGTVSWWGVLDESTGTWTLTSVGTVQNPTGPSTAPVTRTLTAKTVVKATLTQPLNTPIWDYIYSTKPASSPATVCDMTLRNTVSVDSPLYVEGNLCLQQSSKITKGPLVVKGRLTLSSSQQNTVGYSTARISSAAVGNGCTLANNATHTPCSGDPDNVFANSLTSAPPQALNPPSADWDRWYQNASPGPYHACATKVVDGVSYAPFGPYPTFDNPLPTSGTADMNNNLAAQDLTPGSSYRCETAAGSLIWDATAHKLTIAGTIFIDGPVYVQNGAINEYDGQGVIYVRGSFLLKNSSLCARIYNGACDTRTPNPTGANCPTVSGGWNPNCELLAIVANGPAGQTGVGTADSITLTSGYLQGAAFAVYELSVGTSSGVAGPMVGSTVNLGQSVSTSFPSITIVPDGMPSNPTAYAEPQPPGDFSG